MHRPAAVPIRTRREISEPLDSNVITSMSSQEIGWEERLRNDLFCRVWRKTLTQSVNAIIPLSFSTVISRRSDLVGYRAAVGTEFLSPYPPHTHTHGDPHGDPHTHGRPGRLRRMYAGGMNSVEILSYVWSIGLLHVSLSGQSSACRNCIYDILLTCCKQKRTDAQCDILATVELQCRYEAVVDKKLKPATFTV